MTACLVLTLVGMAQSEENVKIPPGDAPPPQLTLESALDRVIATDQTVAIADYEVRKAGLDEWRALTRVMPSLSLGAQRCHFPSWNAPDTPSPAALLARCYHLHL